MALTAGQQKNLKIRFEKRLIPKINRILRATVDAFGISILRHDPVPGVPSEPLTSELFRHYHSISRLFCTQCRSQLTGDVSSTAIEDEQIDLELSALWVERSIQQADFINATSQRQMEEVLEKVRSHVRLLAEQDEPKILSEREKAILAKNLLRKRWAGRAKTIAAVETQYAAEASKFVETNALIRATVPSLKRRTPAHTKIFNAGDVHKRWDSVGDSKVRTGDFNHLIADGQLVLVVDAFLVSGQFLMFPGDTSLGASKGNIINCRCSSDVLIKDVILVRAGFLDTVVATQELPKPLLPPAAGEIPAINIGVDNAS